MHTSPSKSHISIMLLKVEMCVHEYAVREREHTNFFSKNLAPLTSVLVSFYVRS